MKKNQFNKYTKRVCPSCGSNPSKSAEIKTKQSAEDLDFEDLIPQWNGFYKNKSIFSYVRCHDCGLLYAPIYFNNEQLAKLYEQMPPNMDVVPVDALKKTQNGYFNKLQDFSKLDGGFLEIGPDVGYFVESCVEKGNFSEFWLLEPNISVRSKLESVVKNHSCHIIHKMDGLNLVPDGACMVAVMVHVLDHLTDPLYELKKIKSKLKLGGTLLIVTHDESSILRKITRTRWPAFCLQHPQIYNPQSIKKLLENAGVSTEGMGKSGNYFEIGFLLKHLFWLFGIRLNSVPKFLNKTIGLKLGNMVTVAAKI